MDHPRKRLQLSSGWHGDNLAGCGKTVAYKDKLVTSFHTQMNCLERAERVFPSTYPDGPTGWLQYVNNFAFLPKAVSPLQ